MSAEPVGHHSLLPLPVPLPVEGESFERLARYSYEVIGGAWIMRPRAGTPPITADDLPALPYGCRDEIFEGSLIVTPAPGGIHQYLIGQLLVLLEKQAPSGWVILQDVNVKTSLEDDDYFRPDLTVLRPGESVDATWFTYSQFGLLVEVASPSTEWLDEGDKLELYAAQGIEAYWRIQRGSVNKPPTVYVHTRPENGVYRETVVVGPGDTLQTDVPFPLLIDPDALMSRLR